MKILEKNNEFYRVSFNSDEVELIKDILVIFEDNFKAIVLTDVGIFEEEFIHIKNIFFKENYEQLKARQYHALTKMTKLVFEKFDKIKNHEDFLRTRMEVEYLLEKFIDEFQGTTLINEKLWKKFKDREEDKTGIKVRSGIKKYRKNGIVEENVFGPFGCTVRINDYEYYIYGESQYDRNKPMKQRSGTVLYLSSLNEDDPNATAQVLKIIKKAIENHTMNTEPDCFVEFK